MWWNKSKKVQHLNDKAQDLDVDIFDDSLDIDSSDLEFLDEQPKRKYGSGIEIVGQKFNRWTVLSRVDPKTIVGNNKYNMFEVICDCGVTNRLTSYVLTRGGSTMCKRCHIKNRRSNHLKFCR